MMLCAAKAKRLAARELIAHFQRRRQVDQLMSYIYAHRPDIQFG